MSIATQSQKGRLFGALELLGQELGQAKTAAVRKRADGPTPKDPGGYQGASSHPTTDVDNSSQEATEGARSSENEADVKEDQGEPSVNNAKDAKPGQQDDVQLNIGVQQSATGEDSSIEDDYKAGKDDPGSDHPARTDNDALDGQKYAAASFADLHKFNVSLSNGILADLANGFGDQLTKKALDEASVRQGAGNLNPVPTGEGKKPNVAVQPQGKAPAGEKTASAQLEEMIKKAAAGVRAGKEPKDSQVTQNVDLNAGYELAAHLGIDKSAAQKMVGETIETTLRDAVIDADLFGSMYQQMNKQAEDDGSGEDHDKSGDGGSGANGADGAGGPGGADGGGGGPDSGGAPGGDSLGDALGGGGDPGGMMGGGGGGGGDPLGGASKEQVLMELVAALQELGISPEELAAVAQQGGGAGGPGGPGGGLPPGGPGGPPPGGDPAAGGMPMPPPGGGGPPGAAPPGGDPMMAEGMKLASAAKGFQRSGKYRFKAAEDGSRERRLREEMKEIVLEIMSAGR